MVAFDFFIGLSSWNDSEYCRFPAGYSVSGAVEAFMEQLCNSEPLPEGEEIIIRF